MARTQYGSAALKDSPPMMGSEASSLVMTLAYFSLFKHPLREEELLASAHYVPMKPETGKTVLRDLISQGILEVSGQDIFLRGDAGLAEIRSERNARAEQWQEKVDASVRILSKLPFLRGLLISGSLSKGTQDADGDIDFLVLTSKNRLWTARFLTSLFLRLVPRSKRKQYCLNYLMPEDRLYIGDHTLFTATEVVFLKPAMNERLCAMFFKQNEWVKDFYPNWDPPTAQGLFPNTSSWQRLLEWPFSGLLGDMFEHSIRRLLMKRYKRTIAGVPFRHAPSDVRVGPWEIKGHTKGRHEKVRREWHKRIQALELDLGLSLVHWPWRAGSKPAAVITPARNASADTMPVSSMHYREPIPRLPAPQC